MSIVYPENWSKIGTTVSIEDLESAIVNAVDKIDCNYLSLSGGIDSSLLLYYMIVTDKKPVAFTVGLSSDHPDVFFATKIANHLDLKKCHHIYIPNSIEIENEKQVTDILGDNAVRLFYKFVESMGVYSIITGDGIDEFSCGYYTHQACLNYSKYYDHLRELQSFHLLPLHKNSGKIKVYLPYLNIDVILLLSQIPLELKVDAHNRKKLIIKLAQRAHIPDDIIYRHKYGFCDALRIK